MFVNGEIRHTVHGETVETVLFVWMKAGGDIFGTLYGQDHREITSGFWRTDNAARAFRFAMSYVGVFIGASEEKNIKIAAGHTPCA